MRRQVGSHHAAHPELAGLPLADVRTSIGRQVRGELPKATAAALAELAIAEICRDGFFCNNGVIRHVSHRPTLPPRLRAAGEAACAPGRAAVQSSFALATLPDGSLAAGTAISDIDRRRNRSIAGGCTGRGSLR